MNRDIAIKQTLEAKCKERDEQAEIILQITSLAKKLKHCNNLLAEKIRYPEFLREEDFEELRRKLDYDYWYNCLNEYQVEKYLTTTDKEKLFEKLEEESPVFNVANVNNTVLSFMNSKEATATAMIKKIYEEVTDIVFRKGGKGQGDKRIQTGIPKMFRASMFYVYGGTLPSYVSSSNSNFNLIDDLERACYLVDGKTQPDRQNSIESLTTLALRKEENIVEGPYFQIQIFKNGNVKVKFNDLELLKRLNYWGLKGNRLK